MVTADRKLQWVVSGGKEVDVLSVGEYSAVEHNPERNKPYES